jgi:Fe-S cluster assembly scaffold protein SufB
LLRGDNSRSSSNSIIYGLSDSEIDIGTYIELIGKNSKGEIVSRSVAKDNSIVNARGHLNAKTNDCFAHLDCRGILMSKEATMYSVPELTSTKAPKAHLSHEAAIGPISDEEIEYLMSRGLTKDKAISMITNGFLDVKLLELPEQLESYIKKMIEATTEESL